MGVNKQVDSKLAKESAEALLDSLIFSKRRKLHDTINERIKKISGVDAGSFQNVIPEYLFYSNLGRSDLIFFESWLTDFRKKNEANLDLL